jgi:hypothetical protein
MLSPVSFCVPKDWQLEGLGLCVPLPAYLRIKFSCVSRHSKFLHARFSQGAMDLELVIPPLRRVCDNGFLAVLDGLFRRSFEFSDEEILFACFCVSFRSGHPI